MIAFSFYDINASNFVGHILAFELEMIVELCNIHYEIHVRVNLRAVMK